MIKIAVFDAKQYDIESMKPCGEARGVDFKFFEPKLTADTVGLAAGYDGVCVFVNDTVDAGVIDRLTESGIRLLALRCAGYNNVDVKHAYGRVHVVHVPAYSPYAVAEHAMAMILTSVRRIHKAYARTRDFNFSLSGLTGFDLHGKSVGVVGTGRIGRVFIDICRGFGMNVIAYDKYPAADAGIDYVSLDELYSRADIISFHCPLTDETYHMLNRDSIGKLKRGVVIVNTSRGALIDAEALLAGIKSRVIGAACLDVYEEESDIFFEDNSGHIMDDDTLARLLSMPNVLVTSHQAFLTREALHNIAERTVDNIVTFFERGTCEDELCYHCGKTATCRSQRLEKCF